MDAFVGVIIMLSYAVGMGFATQAIIENRGYTENWFWWGFLFGIIAMLVALSKPRYKAPAPQLSTYDKYMAGKSQKSSEPIVSNTWRCSCGRINPHYVGTCVCGVSQHKIKQKEDERKKEEQLKKQTDMLRADELNNLKLLKEYKNLLDSGVITQEEFDKKKAELL